MAMLGGFPYMRSPTPKSLAANQIAQYADPNPIKIENHTCQNGGGVFDAIAGTAQRCLQTG
jgi:hypothetical protein